MMHSELLESYYRCLDEKRDCGSLLTEDFRFVGGDMTKPDAVVGRETYLKVLQGLSRLFSAVAVDKVFVEGDEAFVLATYDWTFPHGVNVRGPVAELWTIRADRLAALTIFFDTASFARLAK